MDKVNLSLQVIPVGVSGTEAQYALIDRVIEMIKKSGYSYEVGPMETCIQGDLSGLLKLVEEANKLLLEGGVERIVSNVKIDCKAGGVEMLSKVERHR
uniref:Thiamine-binding protein domain-containing protein n=1 Tax=Chromera velia CCMP2878 TaxID=1169474 RepID=A0A0G4HID8_9ALVE|mmetsp:Transcript_24311/g.47727  ORF Transcript_24311/g.47727 Transcript_24311/m.47727 type:complete len:98 (-) Transcript_24311:614-907(-)|eukprot:Cvel_27897.t1-p1 / transcript=Cvel_27897.t1 / gene=Cvel_27897 / organism=Chromera_velia_CCMP2878 / gene_product=UPF0045 protein CPE1503, putative / transcript_product=UPF0045 protein CPE1503, putative / location=Cvel_scaffold3552:12689-13199(+) / protein_length=97 / sequence_SO=supercontig / SO=protein_coding / is_pseudo=false